MMFGHGDDMNQSTQDNQGLAATAVAEPVADGALAGSDAGQQPINDIMPAAAPAGPAVSTDQFLPSPSEPTDAPATASNSTRDDNLGANDGLLNLKQQALQQLSPLLGHLEQSPEEKFRTTMMMIQASDDQSLLQAAYEAAQAIPDEKTKAQALLDVVNEINYFTQHPAA